MNKLYAIVFMAMLALTGKAFAEMSYGVSAALTKIDASGTETEGGEKTDGSADNTVIIPSVFVEYAFSDTISVGLDYIPMTADVSDKTKKRQDTETSVTGTVTTTSTARTQNAQAELENHLTLYAHYNMTDTMYLKVGAVQVDLNTTESLGTGSKYGNETLNGGLIGIGAQSGNSRFEVVYTDYEDVSLKSSVARTGVTTNNKIDADLDTIAFKYSYAF